MNQKIKVIVIVGVVVSVMAGGFWYFSQNPDRLSHLKAAFGLTDEAEAKEVYSASGYIEADEIDVTAETRGRITRLTVDEGDPVEPGQVLVELDTALLEAEVRQAMAEVAKAKAHLAKVEAGLPAEEIAKAEATVAVAEAEAEAAHIRWQDAMMLRDNPQELDMKIDAARTAVELGELKITSLVPAKDAAEVLWELRHQQWDFAQEGAHMCRTHPQTGQKMCRTLNFEEGQQQDIGVAWNQSGADKWQAWAELNSAVAELEDAEAKLNDLLRLRNDPQEAQIKVAQAAAAYQTAQAQVEVAKARLEALKAGPRTEQVAVARARVDQAKAGLEGLAVRRGKHILTAPFEGRVVKQPANEGEMATPGSPLMTLADLSHVTLTVYVPEPDVGLVSIGQTVKVFVDAYPGQPFTGRVTYISDEAEFTPKNVQTKEERINTVFAVKIKLDNPDLRLKPGAPADAILSEGPEL